jgi:hypothetical protein
MKLRLEDVPSIVFTFGLFCAGAVFFRARSFHDAGLILGRILRLQSGGRGPAGAPLIPIMFATVLIIDLAERRRRVQAIEATRTRARLGTPATPEESVYESIISGLGAVQAGLLVGVLLAGVTLFSGGSPTPFIYFHF